MPEDEEVLSIAAISGALSGLDDDARRRVLSYVVARFLPGSGNVLVPRPAVSTTLGGAIPPMPGQRELPGIARLNESGELQMTVRDLKAKSGLDAAVRLAHVAILANDRLTNQPLSSSKGLTPILKQYRLYDGNTRTRLAKERGILRSGDALTLDAHAQREAERFEAEILDDSIQGHWKPR